MSTETNELLHALEVLRQSWSHNPYFEELLGDCYDKIHEHVAMAEELEATGSLLTDIREALSARQHTIVTTYRVLPVGVADCTCRDGADHPPCPRHT